jgi:hypothetical protein
MVDKTNKMSPFWNILVRRKNSEEGKHNGHKVGREDE